MYTFKTAFGKVFGYPETEEFYTTECAIIARNADHDGPYWEDDTHDWGGLNNMCHRIFDSNLYSVALDVGRQHGTELIDSTSSYDEMKTWSAWVTNSPAFLWDQVVRLIKWELQGRVNKAMPILGDASLEMAEVVAWASEIFTWMMDNDEQYNGDFSDAFDAVAKSHGYVLRW